MEAVRMNRTKSQYSRVIELDRRIRSGKYPNCLTFSAEWEVSQKTIQRDIDFLRDQCGAPIAYDRVNKGFYYEDDTWILPSIMLSEGELLAVLIGTRAVAQYAGTPIEGELRRVFSNLTTALPDGLSISPELLYNQFSFTSPPARAISPDIWIALVRGLTDRATVQVRYTPFNATTTPKKLSRINPYHIANLQGEWYVFAVHDGHQDVRQFTMARIDSAKVTDKAFTIPKDFSAQPLIDSAFGRYAGEGKQHTVRLLFDKDIATWITERQWHPQQKIKRRRNGDIELSFPARGLYEVQRWVLSWGHQVRVLAPTELQLAIRKEVQRMARQES